MNYSTTFLANGVMTLYSREVNEVFHPVLGAEKEAELLYIRQTNLRHKFMHDQQITAWDVGLGAAGNALAVVAAWEDSKKGHLNLLSFDNDLEPLKLAVSEHKKNPINFGYLSGPMSTKDIVWNEFIESGLYSFKSPWGNFNWVIKKGDFAKWVEWQTERNDPILSSPRLIMYDLYSPPQDCSLWQMKHWKRLRKILSKEDPGEVIFHTRSTAVRVTLLLAGFFVGRGVAIGNKEETTIASNRLELIKNPLDLEWLKRVKRSSSSQPFLDKKYYQKKIEKKYWEMLCLHPQLL
ncbi:MAG: MnmC family methyltransferase [Verrucomicrobiota bacterium]